MNPLDATSILAATGMVGVFCAMVAETGLLPGFFLPGASLLFAAGLLAASTGPTSLPLGWLLPGYRRSPHAPSWPAGWSAGSAGAVNGTRRAIVPRGQRRTEPAAEHPSRSGRAAR